MSVKKIPVEMENLLKKEIPWTRDEKHSYLIFSLREHFPEQKIKNASFDQLQEWHKEIYRKSI